MFFAGNTPKRGFSTRNCKESARMAFLRTSLAADPTLVSGAYPALASGAPRPAARHSWGWGADLRAAALVLAMLGLGVVGTLPTAVQAKALASASVDIKSVIWYKRTPGVAPDPLQDPIITSRYFLGSESTDTYLGSGGLDSVWLNAQLPEYPGAAEQAYQERSIGGQSGLQNDIGAFVECGPTGCTSASNVDPPPPLAPVSPPPASQAAGGYGFGSGFYADIDGVANGLTGGVRSTVSLTEPETSGQAGGPPPPTPTSRGALRSAVTAFSDGDFSTYFAVTFVAQAIAFTDAPEDTAAADASLTLTFAGDAWTVFDINSRHTDSEWNKVLSEQTVYSYDTQGFYDLTDDGEYPIVLLAHTYVNAETGPANVSAPSVGSLVLAGVFLLIAGRSCRFRPHAVI
jgi:hypothetical protein